MCRDGRRSRGRSRSRWIPVLIVLLGLTSCQTGGPGRPSTPPPTSPETSTPGSSGGAQLEQPPATVERRTATAPATNAESGGIAPATETNVATATATTAVGPTASAGAAVPNFDHIYVIVFENKELTDVVGSESAPYLNSLIHQYGLATSYTGVAHPSQPNYLAIWAGSTFGVADDGVHDLTGETLGDQLEAADKTWGIYAENYPVGPSNANPSCFVGASASDGGSGSGSYSRKHDPAMSFVGLSGNASRCAIHVTSLSRFDAASSEFSMIVPDSCHDMHDCPVATGDAWLSSWLPAHILNTDTWKETNSALFITWDEGDSETGGGGIVPMIVVSNQTPVGFRSSVPHNHYSLLATIEAGWNLGCLRNACTATTLAEFFGGR